LTVPDGCCMFLRNEKSRAGIAQLVEYKLPKLGVAGSTPVARSTCFPECQACPLFEVINQIEGMDDLLRIAD
jgi:hypothetical protein